MVNNTSFQLVIHINFERNKFKLLKNKNNRKVKKKYYENFENIFFNIFLKENFLKMKNILVNKLIFMDNILKEILFNIFFSSIFSF